MSNNTITELVQRLQQITSKMRVVFEAKTYEPLKQAADVLTSQQAEIDRLSTVITGYVADQKEGIEISVKQQAEIERLLKKAGVFNEVVAGKDAYIHSLEDKLADLDRSETQLIQERDHHEEIINRLCDTVLGANRTEWSNAYHFEDAVEDIEIKIAILDTDVRERDNLRDELHTLLTALEGQTIEPPASLTENMASVLAIQRREAEWDRTDAYMIGLYNGMLMICCTHDNIQFNPMRTLKEKEQPATSQKSRHDTISTNPNRPSILLITL